MILVLAAAFPFTAPTCAVIAQRLAGTRMFAGSPSSVMTRSAPGYLDTG